MKRRKITDLFLWICMTSLVVFCIFMGSIILGGSNEIPLNKSIKTGLEGRALPSFNLLLPDSATVINTTGISTDKSIALFLFSPDCPYCEVQIKEITENISSLENIDFYVFTPFPFSDMRRFYDRYELRKIRNIKTGIDYENFCSKYFGTTSVPYLAIYGKDRRLTRAFKGIVSSKQIRETSEE